MRKQEQLSSRLKRALWVLTAPEKWAYRHGVLSPERLPLPHFLGIGVPRSGTTWLYLNLRRHPDIFVVPQKELHYFNGHFGRLLSSYANHFRPADRLQVRGEITPTYLYLPLQRIQFIRDVMPEVRLVTLLRDPVDRAWSDILRIKVLLTGRSIEQVPESELLELARDTSFLARSKYTEPLGRWRSVFPPDQLFIGQYEDILERPRMLLEQILVHIGVPTRIDWDDLPYRERFHSSGEIPMPPRVRTELEKVFAARSTDTENY